MSTPVFGPVPSRRLGRSLGINNVIGKTCTYNCIYCQAGRTEELTVKRRKFYDPGWLVELVLKRINELEASGEKVDYVTFVPNGEPTLDINIGLEARMIREVGLRIAVISNGSLLWMDDVRDDLYVFDLVSVKVDAVTPRLWRLINRPHPKLRLDRILEGVIEFSKDYRGKLLTETMLVDSIDYTIEAEKIGEILVEINPARAYIMVPVRPPAEKHVKPPEKDVLVMVYEKIRSRLGDKVSILLRPEEGVFTTLGDVGREILSIISVHPLRLEEVEEIIRRRSGNLGVIDRLIRSGQAEIIEYGGRKYLVAKR